MPTVTINFCLGLNFLFYFHCTYSICMYELVWMLCIPAGGSVYLRTVSVCQAIHQTRCHMYGRNRNGAKLLLFNLFQFVYILNNAFSLKCFTVASFILFIYFFFFSRNKAKLNREYMNINFP